MNLQAINSELRDRSPKQIVLWALKEAKHAVITTNFRPYEACILHAVTGVDANIPVIWCDTGYNTPATYKHANELIEGLSLNVDVYVPLQTAAYRNATMGIPGIDDPLHKEFTAQVKLEPFSRAMAHHRPDVWFTNLRKDQTEFRSGLDIVTRTGDGVLKVCPFFHWSDTQLDAYLAQHNLPNETNYFDPTKALANRECGLHTQ